MSRDRIKMDPNKVQAISQWPEPKNLEELQTFLGMYGFYCQFIKDYAKIVVPLTDQLKGKGKTFEWGEN